MAEVELKGVGKRFGGAAVVRDVNLLISDNEFIVLVGPSGCGKSTTLRMVAGLESVSSGEIRIGQRVVNDVPPKDRDIAMVFQNYALYPHMTVFDNMAFGLKMQKRPRDEIRETVQATARILGLFDFLDRKPATLSGGQRQRVAMGRAIVRRPEVFLFDEPLSNLDAQLRTQMRMELRKLHLQLKTTTIYVTHDQVEAMTLADRIVIMKDGIVQQVGSPVDVYEKPVNVFVARFIGNPPMNVLAGETVAVVDGLGVRVRDLTLPVPARLASGLTAGREVMLGLRPDAIRLADDNGRTPEAWHFPGTVAVAEVVGRQSLLELTMGGNALIAELEGHVLPGHGETLTFGLDLERMHLFDPETTRALS